MLHDNFQIAESDIAWDEHTGRFQWHLHLNGNEIASRYAEIAPSDGELGDSNMKNMMQTPSIFSPGNYAISYGFYDSGPGVKSLTNQDQSYVYVTQDRSSWMGSIASQVGNSPFSRFVLPGAHDAGMYDTTCVNTLLKNDSFQNLLGAAVGLGIATLPNDIILRIVENLAFTQKDEVNMMCLLGTRYFDFRPGYCITDTTASGGLYHQHNFIPGCSFDDFIQGILGFLDGHPSEIVVVALGHSGFNQDYMKATPEALWSVIQRWNAYSQITIGGKQDLASTYNTLLQENKRLIILGQYGFDPTAHPGVPLQDASKYDSYSDSYQTTDVNVILDHLNGMNQDGQNGNDYTVLQLQGTASGANGGIFTSVATFSDASSPLMSTKAMFDHSTYPWLLSNVPGKFTHQQLLVCLNDFADNALVEHCMNLTLYRG